MRAKDVHQSVPLFRHHSLNKLAPRFLTIGLVLELLVLLLAWQESSGETTRFFQGAARLSGRVSLLFFVFLMIYAT